MRNVEKILEEIVKISVQATVKKIKKYGVRRCGL